MNAAAIEAVSRDLPSDPYVRSLTELEAARATDLHGLTGELPSLSTYTTPCGVEPIPRYRRQINRQAGYIGGRCVHEVMPYDDDFAIRRIQTSTSDADMVFLPIHDPSRTQDVIAAIQPHKDIDNQTGESPWRSATALAIVVRLNLAMWGDEWFKGKSPDEAATVCLGQGYTPEHIFIVGDGAVGTAAANLLREQGMPISEDQIVGRERNQKLLRHGLPRGAVLLTASPQAAQIRNKYLREDSIVVDAGCGIFRKKRCGNAHPELFMRPDIAVTPPTGSRSVGHSTAGILWLHDLEAMRTVRVPDEDLIPLGQLALAA